MPSVVLLPGTVVNAGQWTNPNNAKVDDGVVASSTTGTPSTGFLKASNYNAVGTIPSTATITAIQGRIKKNCVSAGSIAAQYVDENVSLFWSGGALGVDQADTSTHWNTSTLTDSFYGGSNSTWGWVPVTSIVLDSSFGIEVRAQDLSNGGNGNDGQIDVIELTLWYDTTIWIPQVLPNTPVFVKPEVVSY